jgi:hypothetical protein
VTLQPQVWEGSASLAVAGGRLWVGARAFVEADGGLLGRVDWDAGARAVQPLDEPVLLLGETGFAFARACLRPGGTPCTPEEEALVLRALDARSGAVRWETSVLPEDAPGTLHEAALVQGSTPGVPGGVSTLTSVQLDGGPRAHVQLFAEGERLVACPLPGTPRVAGAVYAGHFVYVVLERGGSWWLEAFDLGGLVEAESRGWPQRHGLSGSRRERP